MKTKTETRNYFVLLAQLAGTMMKRTAMMLLLTVMTVCTAQAKLTCQWSPQEGGSVVANGNKVYVTLASDQYCLERVQWSDGTYGITLTEEVTPVNEEPYYLAPNENGTVFVTFVEKTTKVLVTFDLNGYGDDTPAEQKLTIGQTVTRPDNPTSRYADFVGWYTDAACRIPYDFATTLDYSLAYSIAAARSTLKLYAKWTAHTYNGACGKVAKQQGLDGWEVTWELSKSTGSADYDVLTISGNGAMRDYSSMKERPWNNNSSTIKTLIIEEGVTSIGQKAFRELSIISEITIPASVTSIRSDAFRQCQSVQTLMLAEDSKLTKIGASAFCQTSLDSDITLPASVTKIGEKAFGNFKGEHLYINVPEGKILTVNGKEYEGEIGYSEADLTSYLFKGGDRSKSQALTLAITSADGFYYITTDGIAEAYYFEGTNPIERAREGETVVLSWGGRDVPEGQYVSGFTIEKKKGRTLEATPNTDNTDYTFIMPADDVTVTTLTAPQEEFVLDLTEEEDNVVVITKTQYMLMSTLRGYTNYDETLQNWCIDLNRDGKADLRMTLPIGEDEESDDEFADEYTVRRLPGLADVTENYHFTFDYPFPYRYNRLFVKLSDSYQEAQQPKLAKLDDNDDNGTTLSEWAGDGKKHDIILMERTLYRDGDWNTLCLPFNVTLSDSPLAGGEAHSVTAASVSNKKMSLTFGEAVTELQAGVPYIIKWPAAAENIVEPAFLGVTIPDMGITAADRQGDDKYEKMEAKVAAFYASKGYDTEGRTDVKTDERVRFLGTYKRTAFDAEDMSILFFGASNKLYYPKSGASIEAQRAYFKLGNGDGLAHPLTAFTINFNDGETTALTLVNGEERMVNSEVYDLQGRRVMQSSLLNSGKATLKKGLYIVNGKKVVIK